MGSDRTSRRSIQNKPRGRIYLRDYCRKLFQSYGNDESSCCGSWNLGDSDWPYSMSNLKAAGYGEKTGFVKTKSTQWGECGKRVVAKRNYPNGQAKKTKPCLRFWPCCNMSFSEERQVAVAVLLDVIKAKVVAGPFNSQVMLGFINGATGSRCFAQCVSFSKKPFEAELIKHKLVGNVDAADSCPYDLEIASGDVCSEIELALELVRERPKWDILHLSLSRGSSMARVVVTNQCVVDPSEEKTKAAALLASKKKPYRYGRNFQLVCRWLQPRGKPSSPPPGSPFLRLQ